MNEAASGGSIVADATPTDLSSWRTALRWAIVAVVVSRLVVWVAGLTALSIWGVYDVRPAAFDPQAFTRPFGELGNALVGPTARWDSVWFLTIAEDGYSGDASRAAFFPLYPGLIALLAPVFGSLMAGVIISVTCFTAALAAFFRLASLELGAGAARWGTMALALFPGAFWFSAVYSESLFLLLSVGAVLAARERRWLIAGVLGALAAATRSAGVLLVIPIALLWWDARRSDPDRVPLAGLGAAFAVPLGLLATCVTFAVIGHGFFAPFDGQENWGRAFRGPWAGIVDGTSAAWDGVRQLLHGPPPPLYFDKAGGDPMAIARHNVLLWLTLVVAVVLLIGAFRRLRPAHSAYALTALLLPLSYPVGPQPLMSLPRFVAVLYPLFLVAGVWLSRGPRWLGVLVLTISAVGLAVVSALVTDWRWVA